MKMTANGASCLWGRKLLSWHLLEVYGLKSGSSNHTYPSTGTLPHENSTEHNFPAGFSRWRITITCWGQGPTASTSPHQYGRNAWASQTGGTRSLLWYNLWAQQNNFYSTSVKYEPSGNSQISHSSEATIRAPLSRSFRMAEFQGFQSGNLPVWLLQETSS